MSKSKKSKHINGYSKYKIFDTNNYLQNLAKYSHLKKAVDKKIRFIQNNPYDGEPLKYELAGYRSISVRNHYIIVYGICHECRKSHPECKGYGDDAVVLYTFGPHDDSYKIAKKMLQKRKKTR